MKLSWYFRQSYFEFILRWSPLFLPFQWEWQAIHACILKKNVANEATNSIKVTAVEGTKFMEFIISNVLCEQSEDIFAMLKMPTIQLPSFPNLILYVNIPILFNATWFIDAIMILIAIDTQHKILLIGQEWVKRHFYKMSELWMTKIIRPT